MNALARNPQQMFGVLIGLEQGLDPASFAARLGTGANALLDLAEAARAGELPRQAYWKGERMRSELTREQQVKRYQGTELFLTDWYRPAIEMMLRPEGALSGELMAVCTSFGRSRSNSKLVMRLRECVESHGFAVDFERHETSSQYRYTINAEDAPRLRAIIANGWVSL
ncbi:MAG: hypothetical protein P0Y65_20600 [Candidatus Devosia phytovorans]|uniref:Uncharacterized protein n=1 Tax=Candidatus Devosia phytovorans TaxID=3121372 RepID=A0AAJ5VTI1_9HYPH|nr:hypothetical protein [Devosia sp.]WEK04543.1 MAG: hypothetical protein P0Y65_20600 [Devosia sp.]